MWVLALLGVPRYVFHHVEDDTISTIMGWDASADYWDYLRNTSPGYGGGGLGGGGDKLPRS